MPGGKISLDTVKLEELREVISLDPLVDLIEFSLRDLDEMVFPVFRGEPNHVGPNTSGKLTRYLTTDDEDKATFNNEILQETIIGYTQMSMARSSADLVNNSGASDLIYLNLSD